MKNFVALKDYSRVQISEMIDLAVDIKSTPEKYYDRFHRKMLVMVFEKPSLRTRVSFETGICQMGGDAIYYDMSTSPLGAGKETVEDTARVLGRYADVIMARLFSHRSMEILAEYAGIPVINGLTDFNHPCQILSDFLTIREHKGSLEGLTLTYLGDAKNNVTHSLLFGCAIMGIAIRVGCPEGEDFSPLPDVLSDANALAAQSGSEIKITNDPVEAAEGADIVYADSWMSYHIPAEEKEGRIKTFTPYQVNAELMKHAAPDAVFMNCLPAVRGLEQTAEVIDGPQSIVFDQAENRLHAQKAIMLFIAGLV
jgi:ornithine carbamoyltransferase